jgi:GNAT superfamily N-acetyltransferase
MNILIQSVHKTQEYFLEALSKEIMEENGVTAFAPGTTDPNLNFAMQTDELKGDIEKIVLDIEKFYERLHLPWRWMMNPSRDQTALKEVLKKRGYVLSYAAHVLVGVLEDSMPKNSLKDFDIKEVGEKKLSDWILPLKEAFQATEENALLYQEVHLRALQKKADFRHFVAYVDHVPAAAATLSLSPYGARLDDLGTVSAHQRKGFGTALAHRRMEIAKELGYSWICLEASDQGALLYKRMGFKMLYRNVIYEKKCI